MVKEKAGPMTAKAISNKMKMKGLQKLKFYCQMCEKQCRDENGFKCHLMSESHQRQLLIFAEQPGRFLDTFSNEFLKEYLRLLQHRFGTKRILANAVYQEYITDRQHIHMNATKWHTLTGFIKWLGRTGLCRVDETEKGWFVQYIDRSPEALAREREREKKARLERTDEERTWALIEKARERDLAKLAANNPSSSKAELSSSHDDESDDDASSGDYSGSDADDAESDEDGEDKPTSSKQVDDNKKDAGQSNEQSGAKISFKLPTLTVPSGRGANNLQAQTSAAPVRIELKPKPTTVKLESEARESVKQDDSSSVKHQIKAESDKTQKIDKHESHYERSERREKPEKSTDSAGLLKRKPTNTLKEIMEDEERRKEKDRRKGSSSWLRRGLVVRIRDDARGELSSFRLKRAIVIDVETRPRCTAKVRIGESLLRVEEADVQTVLPKLGERVLVVNGSYRGELALLQKIDNETCTCTIRLLHGSLRDRVVDRINCDDLCKLNELD